MSRAAPHPAPSRSKASSAAGNRQLCSAPRRGDPRAITGFTLVEVLLAGAISALLLTALVALFHGALDLSRTLQARDALTRDADRAVALLTRDVGGAAEILAAGQDSLVLVAASGDTIRYALNPTARDTLYRQVGQGTLQPVAVGCDSLLCTANQIRRPFTTERLIWIEREETVRSFEHGDWDPFIECCDCEYEDFGDQRVKDKDWVAEEFWGQEEFTRLTRIAFCSYSKEKDVPEVDLIVEVYEGASSEPYYPETLIAQGNLSLLEQTTSPAWHEVSLSTVDPRPIRSARRYWVVWRPLHSGGGTYACDIVYERIKDCDDYVGNQMQYRKSGNEGDKWSDPKDKEEAFFRLYGVTPVQRLAEVTDTLTDTLGVSFRLTLREGEESEYRGGYATRQNP